MSGYIAGAVWNSGPNDRIQRYVLLAIADNANDTGFCWPSIDSLASKCLLSKRRVMSAVQLLESDGWLVVNKKDVEHKGNSYQIVLEKLRFRQPESGEIQSISQVKSATRSKKSGEIRDTSQVKSKAESGEIRGNAIRKNRHEPSVEPSSASKAAVVEDPKMALKRRIREFIQETQVAKTGLPTAPWYAAEGKALDDMVKQNPSWGFKDWKVMLYNWRDSEEPFVHHGDPARKWIRSISRFATGPMKRLDSRREGTSAPKNRSHSADEELKYLSDPEAPGRPRA